MRRGEPLRSGPGTETNVEDYNTSPWHPPEKALELKPLKAQLIPAQN